MNQDELAKAVAAALKEQGTDQTIMMAELVILRTFVIRLVAKQNGITDEMARGLITGKTEEFLNKVLSDTADYDPRMASEIIQKWRTRNAPDPKPDQTGTETQQ